MDTPPTPEDLAAQARPLSGGTPLTVEARDIPLPPEHLVDQLDNQAPEPEPEPEPAEVATLDFFGDELPFWVHPLRYPFMWEGTRYTQIVMRQLTTAQLGAIFRKARKSGWMPETMEVYAVMTGLPAKVLRALPAVDGDPITKQGWDFLPPSLRPASD